MIVTLAVVAAAVEAAVAAAIAVRVAAETESAVATVVAVVVLGEAAVATAVSASFGSSRGSGRGGSGAEAIARTAVLAVAAAEAAVAVEVKLLANGNPEMMDASPPTVPKELATVMPEAPPMLVLEPTECELKQDVHKPLPMSRALLSPMLAVPLSPPIESPSPKVRVELLFDDG